MPGIPLPHSAIKKMKKKFSRATKNTKLHSPVIQNPFMGKKKQIYVKFRKKKTTASLRKETAVSQTSI